jgi:hypothetical protein
LNSLKTRVEKLERTHNILEVCHGEITSRNQKIKNQLNVLTEKEKNLENLLIFALKNCAPNFFLKNDLKYLEGILPESGNSNNLNYNQLVEVCILYL